MCYICYICYICSPMEKRTIGPLALRCLVKFKCTRRNINCFRVTFLQGGMTASGFLEVFWELNDGIRPRKRVCLQRKKNVSGIWWTWVFHHGRSAWPFEMKCQFKKTNSAYVLDIFWILIFSVQMSGIPRAVSVD